MGLCDTVKILADALLEKIPEERRKLRVAVAEIGDMSSYKEQRDLGQWETECNSTFYDCASDPWFDQSEEARAREDVHLFLADELYEFGRYNLYGAYMREQTKREYQALRTKFISAGIPIPELSEVNLEGW